MKNSHTYFCLLFVLFASCKTKDESITTPQNFAVTSFAINGNTTSTLYDINYNPSLRLSFSAPVNRANVTNKIKLLMNATLAIPVNVNYQNNDSIIILVPVATLNPLTKYVLSVGSGFQSSGNATIQSASNFTFVTKIDSSDKFPIITDNQLLDKVQQQTFKYFWDFGHPVSGMARERNSSGDLVTTGGTGFGIMSIITAIQRNFISRAQGLERVTKITDFLLNNCTRYHGAFAHWVNGATGSTIPFSVNDNGGDLVETSLLLQGLITARQYFTAADAAEITLRNKINTIWNGVEWNWYRQNNQNVLYWHWSPDKAWIINHQISGWNEAMLVYVLAASSTTNAIPRQVYDNGWARNGAMRNNNTYYGYQLPLGPDLGGPLFFTHYSFLGINPNGLNDQYANYQTQNTNHTKINYEYCKANPRNWYGYSNLSWGLTASDVPNGYNANAPGNKDVGVISPTASIASMPYTPAESMAALKFFYYKLGDKIWGEYGFYDAFKLSDPWFAGSTLAIDQGPIIIMIENYRSGLLWNLFTSAPEIKSGMLSLGFTAPYL